MCVCMYVKNANISVRLCRNADSTLRGVFLTVPSFVLFFASLVQRECAFHKRDCLDFTSEVI